MADPTQEPEPGQVRLRSYQQEMVKESLHRNVIVALDTGAGKTHIAIARIQHELERAGAGKLVWFMTPNKALSEQQHKVVQEHLPAFHVRCLTGADDVDKWTEQRVWDAFLAGVHVVVGTPAVLADALTHGFVSMYRLALCVFDESHRCTKNHPMNQIMRDFYHPAKLGGQPVPHILGLSASPVMSTKDKDKDLRAVESNLDAVTVTPKHFRRELNAFVHCPEMLDMSYQSQDPEIDATPVPLSLAALQRELRTYDFQSDPYVVELRERNDAKAAKHLREALDKGKTYCAEQLRAFALRAQAIHEQLGSQMTTWFVNKCIGRFLSELDEGLSPFADMSEKEERHLAKILMRVNRESSRQHNPRSIRPPNVSDKARKLIEYLRQNHAPNFRSIVFVEQRSVVKALAEMLRSTPEIADIYNVGTFMGTSMSSKRKATIADLSDLKEQATDLEDFRSGKINLMIATNVLEEGIDIPACNGVICFDLPLNLVSFVQRRGRARMADSRYVLFIPDADMKAHPARFEQLEDQMKQAHMSEARQAPSAADREDEEGLATMQYLVESTGALLTTDNAKAHLQHFCSVSSRHTSRYVDPRPEYDIIEKQGSKTWTASVALPAFIHRSLRFASSYGTWRSPSAAIKDVAFMAYVALHRAGLVNNNLLPIAKDFGPAPGVQHVDQPTIATVSERLLAWKVIAEAASSTDARWFPTEVQIFREGRLISSVGLWLPLELARSISATLYWNTVETYLVSIHPRHSTPPAPYDAIKDLASATSHMLAQVFASRMQPGSTDLPFFLDLVQDNEISTSVTANSQSAIQHFSNAMTNAEPGLIRVAGQPGRAFVFRELRQTSKAGEALEQGNGIEVVVTGFPKRRDFLHKVAEQDRVNAAYTKQEAFALESCEVDVLPAKYAQLVAFLPSILHRIDIALLAEHLGTSLLNQVNLVSTEMIEEALSAPAAQEQVDYNRLEYLGDSILKFCTALQVTAQHPIWPEAYLSAEKDRIVRNSNLAQAALDAGLDRYILTKPFTGSKWRPPYIREILEQPVDQQRQMSSKILADVVEALIGASFIDGGLARAYVCIQTLLPKEEWWDHTTVFQRLLSEIEGEQLASLGPLEDLIGHRFTYPMLLTEAITHVSYPQNLTGMSYERLEFLGDAVLDLIITPKLHAHSRGLRHWELHHVHEALVNAHFLAFCCMSMLGEAEKLEVAKQELQGDTPLAIRRGQRSDHLHDFLRASSAVLKAKQTSVLRFENLRAAIAQALDDGKLYPWVELIAMHADKVISDIVESTLGALYLDTGGDLETCEAFLEKLGILSYMRTILNSGMETTHPKERLGVLADRDEVKYQSSQQNDQERNMMLWECLVDIGGREVAHATKCISKEEAEVRAADEAVRKFSSVMPVRDKRKRSLDDGNDQG